MLPDLHTLLIFMSAALALNVTPGPDMLYVAGRSAADGRTAGIAAALGIGAGTLFHIAAVALGLVALLAAVPIAYTALRLTGAAYLVYLGLRALRRPGGLAERTLAPASRLAAFRQGALTNVLNPKVALFFLAFLPQFVDPARGSAAGQVIALGLLFDASGTLVNLAVAVGASRGVEGLRRNRRAASLLQRATGVLFIALGVRLAVAGRR
ncbi:MAG: LysE family translocator [Gemmatimonadaceae bacterium]